MSLFCKSKMVTLAISEGTAAEPSAALVVTFLFTYWRTVADVDPAEGKKGGETMIRFCLKTAMDDFGPVDRYEIR